MDGGVFYVCSSCFSCDTLSLREERIIARCSVFIESIFSNRIRKSAIHILAGMNGYESDDKRKIVVAKAFQVVRDTNDKQCCEVLAERFNVKKTRVVEVLFGLHLERLYRGEALLCICFNQLLTSF